MTIADWRRVIQEAAEAGVSTVQFIGGEPTLHPGLVELVEHASAHGLDVEVFTNLVHVTAEQWDAFAGQGVRLATSWYSADPDEHAAITGRPSHARTRQGIMEALRRSIPLRVGIIGVSDRQRIDRARDALLELGATDIAYDDLRQVGRGVRDERPGPEQLCGQCANGNLAVSPEGTVWPCVFARWLPVGDLRESSLAEVVGGQRILSVVDELRAAFQPVGVPCVPKMCNPQCGPSCSPACRPKGDCRPVGGCAPKYK